MGALHSHEHQNHGHGKQMKNPLSKALNIIGGSVSQKFYCYLVISNANQSVNLQQNLKLARFWLVLE